MGTTTRGMMLVIGQFALLAWMAKRAYWHLLEEPRPMIFLLAAISLLCWAIWTMRKSRLRILPEPHASAKLITNGPYQYIRHPMYTSVLLGAAALLSTNNSYDMMVSWIALFFVLWSKLGYEEELLQERFGSYRAYQKRTGRLLPFI